MSRQSLNNQTKMSKFTFLFLFAQALLIQSIYSQCVPVNSCGAYNGLGGIYNGLGGLNNGIIGNGYGAYGASSYGGYGGSGVGEIAALGQLGVGGQTYINGNLPTSGAVSFSAELPAAGLVTIVGNNPGICSCACPGLNYYY
ncbi:chorion class A protein L11 [Plutella xylostella]|nr:chorion class A protein L11 [Plutella xylostella]